MSNIRHTTVIAARMAMATVSFNVLLIGEEEVAPELGTIEPLIIHNYYEPITYIKDLDDRLRLPSKGNFPILSSNKLNNQNKFPRPTYYNKRYRR